MSTHIRPRPPASSPLRLTTAYSTCSTIRRVMPSPPLPSPISLTSALRSGLADHLTPQRRCEQDLETERPWSPTPEAAHGHRRSDSIPTFFYPSPTNPTTNHTDAPLPSPALRRYKRATSPRKQFQGQPSVSDGDERLETPSPVSEEQRRSAYEPLSSVRDGDEIEIYQKTGNRFSAQQLPRAESFMGLHPHELHNTIHEARDFFLTNVRGEDIERHKVEVAAAAKQKREQEEIRKAEAEEVRKRREFLNQHKPTVRSEVKRIPNEERRAYQGEGQDGVKCPEFVFRDGVGMTPSRPSSAGSGSDVFVSTIPTAPPQKPLPKTHPISFTIPKPSKPNLKIRIPPARHPNYGFGKKTPKIAVRESGAVFDMPKGKTWGKDGLGGGPGDVIVEEAGEDKVEIEILDLRGRQRLERVANEKMSKGGRMSPHLARKDLQKKDGGCGCGCVVM